MHSIYYHPAVSLPQTYPEKEVQDVTTSTGLEISTQSLWFNTNQKASITIDSQDVNQFIYPSSFTTK